MTAEDRLREVLRAAEGYEPSPDLFARVRRSIEEDAAHRRRIRTAVAASVAGLAGLAAWLGVTAEVAGGQVVVPWWAIEVAVNALLAALVAVFGPLIRRFGATYAGDVFRGNRATGDRFLSLFDIAYYLIFSGYLLLTTSFEPDPSWTTGLGAQLEDAAVRIGGMLLLMGLLHGGAITSLPIVGLLFSSVWRRAVRAEGPDAPPPDPRAVVAERVASAIVWGLAAAALLGLLLLIVGVVLGIGRA